MWNARRILKELADSDRRRAILSHFWKHADNTQRVLVQSHLARAMNFREETIRKMSPEKKAEMLASRLAVPEFEQFFEMALMHYHTSEKTEMMAAFLDRWSVPHENGSIESDDYTPPNAGQVRDAVKELAQYDRSDVAIYLATAGLLMGEQWREGTWPVVEEMAKGE